MKLPYKVMSSAALSVVVASIPVIVHAQAGDFYNQTKQLKYSQSDLRSNATLANKLQDEMDNGDTIIKEVTTGQYLDYVKANDAFINIIANGGDTSTALTEAITAGATSATSDELDGYTPATPDEETLAVSSVSAITATTLKVVLAEAPTTDPTADKFAVTVNGTAVATPTAVVKDLTDSTGKTYKLTVATLDKNSGKVTVNGTEGTFDYAGPTISALKALNNKQIEVTFSEKVDNTTATNVTNYGIYAMGGTGATLVTFTADDGSAASAAQIKALAKQTADNKVVITIGSIGSTVATQGYVLNGLTNGQYLLYVNNVADASANANVIVASSNAQFTGTTTPDSSEAQLLSASYNTGSGKLALSFDKTIKVDTSNVTATKISITDGTTTVPLTAADVAAYAGGVGLRLSDDITAAGASTVDTGAVIYLSSSTKAKVDALTASNLSVVLGEGAFKDATNSNSSAAVTKALTLSLSPLVTSAQYNEDTNVLKLNFNMDIDVAKIASLTGITVGGQSINGVGQLATVKTTTNGSVVEIQLTATQAAAMELAAGLNNNTVVTTSVYVPVELFTKVGATSTDPGLNAAAALTAQTVVQDTTAPTVKASITGLGVGTGILTLTGSEALNTTITPANIVFYTADNLTTPLGALDVADTAITQVGTSNSYTLDLSSNDTALATAINTNKAKGIVVTIAKGAIKDANLTDIAKVDTTAPISVSLAESTYGQAPTIFTVTSSAPSLVTATFQAAGPVDVQLDKATAENVSHYQFVSIANPSVKIGVSTANYVWNAATETGELRLVPATALTVGDYKLTMSGLVTNAGVKVDDVADTTSDNLVTINPVTIVADAAKPTVSAVASDIVLTDADNSGTVTAGDKITIKFNEPVKLTGATGDNFTVSNSHSLGAAGVSVNALDATKVDIILASDSTIALGDTITVKATNAITDLAGNQVDTATAVTGTLAKPSTILPPSFKSAVYADANNNGTIDAGDTLTVKFDQVVKKDSDAAVLTDDVAIDLATFSNAVLSGDTLTLTIDTPDTLAVGGTLTVGTANLVNSWIDPLTDADGVIITSADKTKPTVQSISYGTEGTTNYLYIKMSEAVHLDTTPTFADAFEVKDATTGVVAGTDVLSQDSSDPTVIKVTLVAGDTVIPDLTVINTKLSTAKVLDASGNLIVKSNTTGYTVTQK